MHLTKLFIALGCVLAVVVGCDKDATKIAATAGVAAPAATPEPAPVPAPAEPAPAPAVSAEPAEAATNVALLDLNYVPGPNAVLFNPMQDAKATVKVTVKFAGERPKRNKVDMGKDPKCTEMHTKAPLTEEEIVNKDNMGIQNVFVYVKKGFEGMKFDKPGPVTLNQKGCTYEPHVFGVMPGQEIKVVNSDATTHNVHGMPKKSKEFNFSQNKQGQENMTVIENAEMGVFIKCDIHSWMSAYAMVLPHPFHAVTDANGQAALKLPAGSFEVAVWHEKYGELKPESVTLANGDTKEITFTFKK